MSSVHPLRPRGGRRPVTARRGIVALALLAGVLVAATGCLRGDVDVAVEDDGSGRVELEVFPDSDLQRQLDQVDVASLLAPPTGGTDLELTRVDRDGREGYHVEFDFADADALGTALTSGLVVAGQQVTLFSSFDLREVDYGAWKLDATVQPAGQLLTTPSGASAAPGLQALVDQLVAASPQVDLRLTVSLPGKVVSSNADEFSGGSATWQLDDASAPTDLTMETEAAPLLTTAQLVLVGGVLALVVGILLAMFGSSGKVRGGGGGRRRRAKQAFPGPAPASGTWAPPSGWVPPSSSGQSSGPSSGSV